MAKGVKSDVASSGARRHESLLYLYNELRREQSRLIKENGRLRQKLEALSAKHKQQKVWSFINALK